MASAARWLSKSEWKQVSQIAAQIGISDCAARKAANGHELPGPIVRFACAAQQSEPDHETRAAAIDAGLSDRTADALQALLQALAR